MRANDAWRNTSNQHKASPERSEPTMKEKKRKALEDAGHRVGDTGDFLGLTDEERSLVELRASVSHAVQVRRKKRNLTQIRVAELLNSSQSRVAKIEAGSSDVSLDLMFRGLFAVGGSLSDLITGKSKLRKARAANSKSGIPLSPIGDKAKKRIGSTTT